MGEEKKVEVFYRWCFSPVAWDTDVSLRRGGWRGRF